MTRDAKTLTTFIGVVYLCVGLGASILPAMVLLYAPKTVLASTDSLIFFGTLAFIFGPSFAIGYAWIRRRKWGWYLLIAYNGLLFAYISYGFVARIHNYSESHLNLVVMGFSIPLIVLGSLIALAFQRNVRASMSC
jgi:hypothetical protein